MDWEDECGRGSGLGVCIGRSGLDNGNVATMMYNEITNHPLNYLMR